MSDGTLRFFVALGLMETEDAADVMWSHAVNNRSKVNEALTGPTHMLEADVIMRGRDPREPVMGHPPETDSDITLKEWLEEVKAHDKGIKLDFKCLDAVSPSVALLMEVLVGFTGPLWVNADILPGPGGRATPVQPQAFLSALDSVPAHTVLSLGWTTGWTAGADNPGYSWDMVHEMEQICRTLRHPVTFPVRAALLPQSHSQLTWLLQQSERCVRSDGKFGDECLNSSRADVREEEFRDVRYTLTVWTGQKDQVKLQDLMLYRKQFDARRIYLDLPDSQRTQLAKTAAGPH